MLRFTRFEEFSRKQVKTEFPSESAILKNVWISPQDLKTSHWCSSRGSLFSCHPAPTTQHSLPPWPQRGHSMRLAASHSSWVWRPTAQVSVRWMRPMFIWWCSCHRDVSDFVFFRCGDRVDGPDSFGRGQHWALWQRWRCHPGIRSYPHLRAAAFRHPQQDGHQHPHLVVST